MKKIYGKKVGDLLKFKGGMFDENTTHLNSALTSASIYTSQPPRHLCKICQTPLPDTTLFQKHGVGYKSCSLCGHLNGRHEDTTEFLENLYVSNSGKQYAENYLVQHSEEYLSRTKEIYSPKAEFLLNALRSDGLDPCTLSYNDLGAGAGYFVSALNLAGIEHIKGLEVSASQVEFGTKIRENLSLPRGSLQQISLDDLEKIVRESSAQVLSMIGVLEHLQNPFTILQAIKANENVRYLFISVPMFSPSVMIEAVFGNIFPRHLSGGHTHLFTKQSLEWMSKKFGFDTVSEWWFGTDMLDLYRSMLVTLGSNPATRKLGPIFTAQMLETIDDLQLCLDQREACSEVHLIYRATIKIKSALLFARFRLHYALG
jgi:hypothetical protein